MIFLEVIESFEKLSNNIESALIKIENYAIRKNYNMMNIRNNKRTQIYEKYHILSQNAQYQIFCSKLLLEEIYTFSTFDNNLLNDTRIEIDNVKTELENILEECHQMMKIE